MTLNTYYVIEDDAEHRLVLPTREDALAFRRLLSSHGWELAVLILEVIKEVEDHE